MPGRRHNRPPISYRDSGVDIDAGNALVEAIKPLAKSTRRAGADADLGGFGALFDLKAAGFKDPILVAANDGVGTKLKIAIDTGRHASIGVDLVAMCVNDLLAQGAEPLFFLDYFACGKLDVETARAVVAGIADGCRQAGCALIGGETAEMPGMYAGEDYDLAGFAVGAVERGGIPAARRCRAWRRADRPCLLRRALQRLLAGAPAGDGGEVGLDRAGPLRSIHEQPGRGPAGADAHLCEAVLQAIRATGAVKAIAHITGGGLSENLPRVLPAGLAAHIDLATWAPPAVFGWLARAGNLDEAEMLRTFNCGLGLVLVATKSEADKVLATLLAAGEAPVRIGEIETGRGVKSQAKGKGEADAVRYSGKLEVAT